MKLSVLLVLVLAVVGPARAHESVLDHAERELTLWVAGGALHLRYRLQPSERAAVMDLVAMDRDRDGRIAPAEHAAFAAARHQELAALLALTFDGVAVPLAPAGAVTRDAALGQTYEFTAALPPTAATVKVAAVLRDGYSRRYPGPGVVRAGGPGERVELAPAVPPAAGRDHPELLVVSFAVLPPPAGP